MEHTFIFGVEIEGEHTREEAREIAYSAMGIAAELPKLREVEGTAISWWHAENDRTDRSDNDSAIFVPYRKPDPEPVVAPGTTRFGYVTGEWCSEFPLERDGGLPRAYWAQIMGYAAGGLICRVDDQVAKEFAENHYAMHEAEPSLDGVAMIGDRVMVVYRTELSGADPGVEEIYRDGHTETFGLPAWCWYEVETDYLGTYHRVGGPIPSSED